MGITLDLPFRQTNELNASVQFIVISCVVRSRTPDRAPMDQPLSLVS